MGYILRALPNAKIICLDRDVNDTVISNYRQLFATNFDFYNYTFALEDCAKYTLAFKSLIHFWQQLFLDNFYCVNYQDFVNKPLVEGKKLYEFINEPWQDEYVNIAANSNAVATASAGQVRKGINNQSIGYWKNYAKSMANVEVISNR